MNVNAKERGSANGDIAVQHQIISISVDLGVTTPDSLRHIEFGLEKDTGDDDSVGWTIHFKFQERQSTTDDFIDVVTLDVKVKEQNHGAAEARRLRKKGLQILKSTILMVP